MSLLQLPLELLMLVTSYLGTRDLAHLLQVHPSLHNDILISELHKKEVKANDGLALCHYAHVGNEEGVQQILAAGAYINIKANGETALFKAVRKGHVSVVRILLEKGARAECPSKNGTSPLNFAVETRSGDDDMLKLLLRYGANANESPFRGYYTPLFRAVASCDSVKVKLLLDNGADAGVRDPHSGANPLHTAAQVNAPSEITRMLIKAGSGIDDYNRAGKTPLQVAVLYSSLRAVEPLLDQGADANLSSRYWGSTLEDGKTALFYATDPQHIKPRNNMAILRLLLRHGADVNKTDEESLTALHGAAKNGSISQVQLFLKHGAQVTPQLTSSMLYSAAEGHQKKMVAWLLSRGANVNHRGQGGETSIYGAIRSERSNEDTSIVQLQLKAGANIENKDKQGVTPLSLAAGLCLPKIVKILIEHGADVHTKDNRRQTPLHKAVRCLNRYNALEASMRLIEHGADSNARDLDGCTPVHVAANVHMSQVSLAVLRVLLGAGGNIHTLSHDGKSPRDIIVRRWGNTKDVLKFFAEFGA